ncbi:hypothetical protein DB30_00571 [Enhygromyxa salina]|uniref:Uncharacterized protein n=1 Tax=Enhygromyxa salina TaxID=215803 RepID=A0A0C2CPH7_9BACT|nr:hypothetical protein DB30_00571 [Enhygromyxa salina]
MQLAGRLVGQVHRRLGYYREDDLHRGPLSALAVRDAEQQPTVGGLRIEDPQRDPERDGQCFHDLTKWMHALNQMGTQTGDPIYHRWARELACTAHSAFIRDAAAGRMFCKMSVDLERPLVMAMSPSIAQHDPLDALITYCQLQSSPSGGGPDLRAEIHDAAALCVGASWAIDDALGIGDLLIHAGRVAQLVGADAVCALDAIDAADLLDVIDAIQPGCLLEELLESARAGLCKFADSNALAQPPERRTAFGELELAIGLAALPVVARSRPTGRGNPTPGLDRLAPYQSLHSEIVGFWRGVRSRRRDPVSHEIEAVMLATALVPDGFMELR